MAAWLRHAEIRHGAHCHGRLSWSLLEREWIQPTILQSIHDAGLLLGIRPLLHRCSGRLVLKLYAVKSLTALASSNQVSVADRAEPGWHIQQSRWRSDVHWTRAAGFH